MIHTAYITEPRSAKIFDRLFRAMSYITLAVFSMSEVLSSRGFIDRLSPEQWYSSTVVIGIIIISILAAVSALGGKSQFEYVLLPLLLGFVLANVILAVAFIGFAPHVALLMAFWFLMCARFNWLHTTIVRTRKVQRLYREV